MSHNGRRALFYAFLLIFLVLGSGIVLFAEGWRMDFPSFRVSKVGGIYVRSYPEDASIFLNGKSIQNQSGFLSRGTLISDLFPKTYRLALTAPGYDDWHENANVAPSLVANHKYAVLVPANATSVGTSSIADFVASQSGIISQTTSGRIMFDDRTVGYGKLIAASPDLRSAIFQTTGGTYEFADTAGGTVTNLSNILAKDGFDPTVPGLFLDPFTAATVLAATSKNMDLIDLAQTADTELDTAPPGQTIAGTIAVSPATVAWIRSSNRSASSSLIFYDLASKIVASTTVALGAPVKKMDWVNGDTLGILAENGAFYLYNTDQESLRKIADDVRSASATPDGSRIATIESNSLEIFTLNDPSGYYRFNIPDAGRAQAALWYHDSDHLFIAYPDHVAFLDLQDASLANFTTVSSGTEAQYDSEANALYIIDPQKNLLRFNFSK